MFNQFRQFLLFIVILFSQLSWANELVFVGQDYPPFNWIEQEQLNGGMLELVQQACKKLNQNCKFQIMPLARGLKMMEDGFVDGVLSLSPNRDREAYSNFSQALITSRIVYFTKANDEQKDLSKKTNFKKVKNLNDLQGYTVGVIRGSSSAKTVLKHKLTIPQLTVVEESTNEILVKKIDNDRYGAKSAIAGSEDVIGFVAGQNKVKLEPLLNVDSQTFMIAFSKKRISNELFKDFKKVFSQMKQNGEVKKILDKYSLKLSIED